MVASVKKETKNSDRYFLTTGTKKLEAAIAIAIIATTIRGNKNSFSGTALLTAKTETRYNTANRNNTTRKYICDVLSLVLLPVLFNSPAIIYSYTKKMVLGYRNSGTKIKF